ncbi:MAG: nucleotidyltransferase domain-containing protein [bacterium]|nr:nucleotidyltransferase domain-containing protein [bacterium]
MSVSWSVTPQKIQTAIEKIIEMSRPRKIILFGSYIRGNTHTNSDLDVMVVMTNEVKNPRKESVKIRRRLKGISMPMDILVVSESILDEMADIPGMIYREIIRNGEVVYESKR